MKLIDGLIVTQVGDDYMVVPTGEATKKLSGIIRMNETASDIVTGIQNGLSEDEICAKLMEKYEGVDSEKAHASVKSMLTKLKENDLLEA